MSECTKSEDCPKRSLLGPIFSPFSDSKHFSECYVGGGYGQGYKIKCRTCNKEWEEMND